jgi:ATP-binding cassette subfamily F protein uup
VSPPLVALTDAAVTFGGTPLFATVDLGLARGERACLVGRNGSGKSTLLKALAGELELDRGTRFVQPGTRIAYLAQEPRFGAARTVRELVRTGLADDSSAQERAALDGVIARLQLEPETALATLSGGEARRADLARVLAGAPDVLLLDEPTNHLDLPTIAWLETLLAGFAGAVLTISHDRAFLNNVARRTLWLDRGSLRAVDQGFAQFEDWSETVLEAEAEAAHKLGRKLVSETKWLREGISARRTRNMGRVRALLDLRKQLAGRVGATGRVQLEVSEAERGGSLVIEAKHIAKAFDDRPIVRDFSTRIARGARVGMIGANGAGKTTLLRLLTGDLAPDRGQVKLGHGVEIAYFDQRRAALDPETSLQRVLCPDGGDQVIVNGRPRHVASYLRDFLFGDGQVMSPVKSLSGGERSRLLLAKLFARPSNLAVLDEPTNDLDMDTLDLLQDVLADFPGTVLLVSHDRDFLDRVATSTIALEGDGTVTEYAGGYSDYLTQRPAPAAPATPAKTAKPAAPRGSPSSAPPTKLSYRDQRERDLLPGRIAALEAETAALAQALADPGLYQRDRAAFQRSAARLDVARAELATAEERWLEIELAAEQAAEARAR